MLECWREDEALVKWVKLHNSTFLQLFKDFEEKIFSIVRKLGVYFTQKFASQ